MHAFRIEITRHGWLEGCSPSDDLCSHGGIKLQIGGVEITTGDEDYGICESALALLRTLRRDRLRGDDLADVMIYHGCGNMLLAGCSLGVDWTTRHVDDVVEISDVVRFDAPGRGNPHEFPEARARISIADHASIVTAFARQARMPFESTPKRVAQNEVWPGEFQNFWSEYDAILAQFSSRPLQPFPPELKDSDA